MAAGCLVGAAGCDFGRADIEASSGPALHVLASSPQPSEGMECGPTDAPECGVPTGASFELRFDRFLAPDTATRQSVSVTSGPFSVFFEPRYDVLESVLVFSLPPGQALRPATRYDVQLNIPDDHAEGWGFRAFDGAPLRERGSAPLRFSFRTRAVPGPREEPAVEVSFAEVQAVLAKGGCAAALCHQPRTSAGCPPGTARLDGSGCVAVPRMGLDLSSAAGIEATALGRAARETATGPRVGAALENAPRFGVGMPIIDRGRPENSYLVYKLLAHPAAYRDGACSSRYAVMPEGSCGRPTPDELSRLRDWFLVGEPMPIREWGAGGAVDLEDLRVLTRWIQQGAEVTR